MRFLVLALVGIFFCMPVTVLAAVPGSPSVKPAVVRTAADSSVFRVGLQQGAATVTLTASAEYVLRDSNTGQGIAKYRAGETVTIRRNGRNFMLNQKGIAASGLRILMPTNKAGALLKVDGKSYHGAVCLKMDAQGITVINEVSLEEYLYGVVAAEMSPAWPAEALKAQAVAARTFALYNRSKHAGDGFDSCATTHCQVYNGAADEAASVRNAVDATKGEVLYYQGQPIYAAFHASSGGMTENSEDVWGGYLPYLRAVKDEDSASPYHHWQVKLTAVLLQNKLAATGHNIGILQRIILTPLVAAAGKTADRTASGRISSITFSGTKGSVSLTGTQMRSIFGLKSTLFDLIFEVPDIRKLDASMGFDKKNITANLPDVRETNYLSEKVHIISGKPGESIIIDGYGWGHGLGMAQWGARSMASHLSYRDILLHYYTKVDIKKLY